MGPWTMSQLRRCSQTLAVNVRLVACLVLLAACAAQAATAPAPHATVPTQATLTTSPAQPVAGQPINMSVSYQSLPGLQAIPTSSFQVAHDQLLQMVGVGQDLDTFFHWHPTQRTLSMFNFNNLVFPKAGTYLIALDGQLAAGPVANSTKLAVASTPVMSTAGPAAAAGAVAAAPNRADPDSPTVVTVRSAPIQRHQPAVTLSSLLVNQTLDGTSSSSSSSGPAGILSNGGPGVYTATLFGPQEAACKPGSTVTYVWTFTALVRKVNSSTIMSQPVNDLRPYYGAPMHLAVASSDLDFILHALGEVVNSSRTRPNSSSNSNSNAGGAHSTRQPPAATGHSGHGRKLLRSRDPLAAVVAAHSDAANHTVASTKSQQPPSAAATAPGSPAGSRGTATAGNDVATGLGPVLKTEVVFPTAGRYLLVGQVSRGNELILVPVFVDCTG